MDENTPDTPPPVKTPALRFDVEPYQPDGGFQWTGVSLVIGVLGIAGIILGGLAGLISQWFWLILIFPAAMGGALGGLGALAVKWGKVRNPWLGGLAGFVGGCGAMLAMHYCGYLQFQSAVATAFAKLPEPARRAVQMLADNPQANIPIGPEVNPAERAEIMKNLQEWARDLRVKSFGAYLDHQAQIGVTIQGHHDIGKQDKGMNLGYIGSIIYWLVELLIVAVMAFYVMRVSASQPFCRACDAWKTKRALGELQPPFDEVVAALKEGNVGRFVEVQPKLGGAELFVSAHVCPGCGATGAVDVEIEQVTKDGKGNPVRKTIAQVTYPGEALPVLETLFQPPPASANPPAAEPME